MSSDYFVRKYLDCKTIGASNWRNFSIKLKSQEIAVNNVSNSTSEWPQSQQNLRQYVLTNSLNPVLLRSPRLTSTNSHQLRAF